MRDFTTRVLSKAVLPERHERKRSHGCHDPRDRPTEAGEVGELSCGRRFSLCGIELVRRGPVGSDLFGFVAPEELLILEAKRVSPFRMMQAEPPFEGIGHTPIHECAAGCERPFCTSRRLALVFFGQEFVTLDVSICLERARSFSRRKGPLKCVGARRTESPGLEIVREIVSPAARSAEGTDRVRSNAEG